MRTPTPCGSPRCGVGQLVVRVKLAPLALLRPRRSREVIARLRAHGALPDPTSTATAVVCADTNQKE